MPKSKTEIQIEHMFAPLNWASASNAFPEKGALSIRLNNFANGKNDGEYEIEQKITSTFATSSVEMWHRSIHSFLISASLTKASPVWSSVSGYYSSHYSMRAFAHLLGYFQLRKRRKIVQLEIDGGNYLCKIKGKHGDDAEHKSYWKIVKSHSDFSSDPFFTNNEDELPNYGSDRRSDVGHRSIANYLDHIGGFPSFQMLNHEYLKQRVNKISDMELSDAPIPRLDLYPDMDNVQLIAYHRLVRFKSYLDNIFGDSNRFWKVHRKPSWCMPFLDFQIVSPVYTGVYKDI